MSINQRSSKSYLSNFFKLAFFISILGLVLLVVDFGFYQSGQTQLYLNSYYFVVLTTGIGTTVLRYLLQSKSFKRNVILFDSATVLFTLAVLAAHFFGEEAHRHISYLYSDNWVRFAVIVTFIREFSEQNISYNRTFLNPAQLFILSFLSMIVIGAFLLMLPKATYDGISFVDALFTSTSAVCVTGLIVVDTGSYFTTFGQTILLMLIQAGGLGILTFASYFSYFFKGGSTYENQLTLSDITGSSKIGEVFSALKRIIVITFSIELFSAVLIYLTLDKTLYQSFIERAFFSIFHSVSAFCNAGFSTLSNSLFESGFKYNYNLQLIVIFSFVLGGLGFPIVVNLLKYLKYYIR